MRDDPELFLDHGSMRLVALALLHDRPRRRDELKDAMEDLTRWQGDPPAADLVIEMLVRLGYVNAAGEPAILAPTDDGVALLGADQDLADFVIERALARAFGRRNARPPAKRSVRSFWTRPFPA